MQNEYTEERLSLALAPRTMRYIPSVGSTNDIAVKWLREGAPDGAVVIADEQTAGRGRLGRTWHTPPGMALALSVVLRPSPAQVGGLTMAGVLAIEQVLTTLNLPNLRVKWANDVLCDGLKISGVLPEAIWDGDTLVGGVLGMGVNIRNDFAGTVLDGLATSVEAQIKRPVDRVSLLAVLLFHLDSWLGRLGTEMLAVAYKQKLAYMIGQPIMLTAGQDDVSGIVLDVEADGALVLQTDDSTLRRVYAGDVTVKKSGA